MKKIGFSILIILSFSYSYSQRNFKPGYIITKDNDSIPGFIDLKRKAINSKICLFKKTKKDSIINYTPYQLKAYGIENKQKFVSKTIQTDSINKSSIFFEILIKGKLIVYSYYSEGKHYYYIERDFFKLTEIPYKEYVDTINYREVVLKTNVHKDVLKQYTVDCRSIEGQILKMAQPEESSLIKLVQKYHQITYPNDNNITFYKRTSSLNLTILPSFKHQIIPNSTIGNNSYNYFGSLIMLGNNVNERLVFKTGFLCSLNNSYNNLKTNKYLIPVRIVYIYPRFSLKPFIGLGFNNYYNSSSYSDLTGTHYSLDKDYDLCSELGFIYDINNKIGVYSEFGFDLTTKNGNIIFINSNDIYKKYSILLGLKIKLL